MTRFSLQRKIPPDCLLAAAAFQEGERVLAWTRAAKSFPTPILKLAREDGFSGKAGETLFIRPPEGIPVKEAVFGPHPHVMIAPPNHPLATQAAPIERHRLAGEKVLVREVVDRLATRFDIVEREVETVSENVVFKLPRGLEAAA